MDKPLEAVSKDGQSDSKTRQSNFLRTHIDGIARSKNDQFDKNLGPASGDASKDPQSSSQKAQDPISNNSKKSIKSEELGEILEFRQPFVPKISKEISLAFTLLFC